MIHIYPPTRLLQRTLGWCQTPISLVRRGILPARNNKPTTKHRDDSGPPSSGLTLGERATDTLIEGYDLLMVVQLGVRQRGLLLFKQLLHPV